ncbi:hypothetical protein J8TS2_41560 [Lederbergia ruris]|uniref:Uncharacterized protein n=1 Tax=Lederbergia ruris TaxID=217495 RepID=A0ABQ4KR63_9BACI|nr:hypothetical protein J8TS2_41560 [Lederbergia ruris]
MSGMSGIEFNRNPLPTDSKEFDKLNNWGASFLPNPAFPLTNDEISCEIAFKVTKLLGE